MTLPDPSRDEPSAPASPLGTPPAWPSTDEILRVKSWECSMNGHSWSAIGTLESEDPDHFFCENCGRELNVSLRWEGTSEQLRNHREARRD